MFDLDIDDDAIEAGVCRDETCQLEYVHPCHVLPLHPPDGSSGKPKQPWWQQRDPLAYLKQDPKGLKSALKQVFRGTDWPLQFCDIASAVVNDYGSVSSRSIHRYLDKLANGRFIKILNLGLTFSAYIRADSPRRRDHANLREYILGRRAGVLDTRAHGGRCGMAMSTRWG